ncbi:hypothetical protein KL911_005153 [Ogataea haglerorum]|uniref:uncharacterized protein n=1 Tax=Ogataea haglerorum TaxID=1937702 RepID=UPI001C89B230|nr:uncharacterized protein KL911_005153 [Ogataea haglerorum]KAG7749247.1 hypothetical protein KL911_005153 [Ogataea haglerorum]
MYFFGFASNKSVSKGSIRARALEKLASLSVREVDDSSTLEQSVPDTLKRLLAATRSQSGAQLGSKNIRHSEFEVLLALCRSCEHIKSKIQAEILLSRFELYLAELGTDRFSSKKTLKTYFPTPWTKLSYELVVAVSTLGLNLPTVRPKCQDLVFRFIDTLQSDSANLRTLFCYVGLLQGLTKNIAFVGSDLVRRVVSVFDEAFFSQVESCIGSIDEHVYVEMVNNFEDYGFEFSSLFFMFLVQKLAVEFLKCQLECKSEKSLVFHVLASNTKELQKKLDTSLLKELALTAIANNKYVNNGSDRLVTSTFGRRNAGYSIKASTIEILALGSTLSVVDLNFATALMDDYLEQLYKIDGNCTSEVVEMINSELLTSIFSSAALLSARKSFIGLRLSKCLPAILSLPVLNSEAVSELAQSLSFCLKNLTEDDVVSCVYSLTNILTDAAKPNSGTVSGTMELRPSFSLSSTATGQPPSTLTEDGSYAIEVLPLVYRNVIAAVLEIAKAFRDESINILAVTILFQKVRRTPTELNCLLLRGLTGFVDVMEEREFLILVRHFFDISTISTKDKVSFSRISSVWTEFSEIMAKRASSSLYTVYLHEMLSAIISKGDIDDLEHHRSNNEVSISASEISLYLKPLAYLLPPVDQEPLIPTDKETVALFKDMWFNLCIHGYAHGSELLAANYDSLMRVAHNSPALASESSWNRTETTIDMNTVLRRGTSKHTEKLHKDVLSSIITSKSIDAKVFETQISRPKLMFLASNLLLESLRAECGDCSTSLEYLSDPTISISNLQDFSGSIAFYVTSQYFRRVQKGGSSSFTTAKITRQLQNLFIFCCHRDFALQNAALQCTELLIVRAPVLLCYEMSLFSLLDILSLLYESVIDADTNEYEPRIEFTAPVSGVKLLLSDSYKWRHKTLDLLTSSARKWITLCLLKCPQDTKSLLQSYVSKVNGTSRKVANYGVTFALEMAGKVMPADRELSSVDGLSGRQVNITSAFLSQFPWKAGGYDSLLRLTDHEAAGLRALHLHTRRKMADLRAAVSAHLPVAPNLLRLVLHAAASLIIRSSDHSMGDLLREVVAIPFAIFDADSIELGVGLWLSIMKMRSDLAPLVLSEICQRLEESIKLQKGLYSKQFDIQNSKYNKMEYLPTSKEQIDYNGRNASKNIKAHLLLFRLLASHFEATRYQSSHIFKMFTRTVLIALLGLTFASTHPFARTARFELINFALSVLKVHRSLGTRDVPGLTSAILDGALSWFATKHRAPYGNNKMKIRGDFGILNMAAKLFMDARYPENPVFERKRVLLLLFLDHEISFLATWLHPLHPMDTTGSYSNVKVTDRVLADAYALDGRLALNLVERYRTLSLERPIRHLIQNDPLKALEDPTALRLLLASEDVKVPSLMVLSTAASPSDAINLFLPPFNSDPIILQYTMRSLESFDAHLTFFYVPQIVQALRFDMQLGYVRRFILETAKVSQLFAHQIIWNMAANSYKDEDSTVPDDIKPTLDEIRSTMVAEFTPQDRAYYEREFRFFEEVTGISGKLKPFIKSSKPEKKAQIDKHMATIKVEEGVYLPSNPQGVVVDINRQSGKPLQSHAKAPFMATFKIRKEVSTVDGDKQQRIEDLSAIFKVGDDCRQDLLALQLMSLFRTIWMDAGLDVFVFPYRVTATAPGCGIIDVLPNSISRDMLGREAVNGLYEYFISQHGPETSIEFQKARNNFVKSLAAYSIITYLLEIKDRHNGNIMYDDQGHVLHVDFGFCFDIVPGGVKFEQSPFKLTREMVRVMGGSTDTQAYKWFEELCVKSFLVCRPYMDAIVNMVVPMLSSGLPCFKPATIKHLTARFVPKKSDKEAARYIRGLIRKSFESLATKGYDEFQRLTNGIPY